MYDRYGISLWLTKGRHYTIEFYIYFIYIYRSDTGDGSIGLAGKGPCWEFKSQQVQQLLRLEWAIKIDGQTRLGRLFTTQTFKLALLCSFIASTTNFKSGSTAHTHYQQANVILEYFPYHYHFISSATHIFLVGEL